MGKLELTCHLLVNCNIAAVDTEYAAPLSLSNLPPPPLPTSLGINLHMEPCRCYHYIGELWGKNDILLSFLDWIFSVFSLIEFQ